MIIYVQHQIQQKEIEIYLKFVKFKNKDRFRLQFLKFKKAVQNLWQHLNLQFISLGDIFICQNKIEEQAFDYGHSIEREAAFLFVHGFLHLLGYDHETKNDEEEMFNLQKLILEKTKFKRIIPIL